MKQHLIYIILGLIIILLYFSRLFVPEPQLFSTPDFGHSDLWHFNIPMRQIYWEALQKNILPFIDQRIGNGFPVFAENQIGALNLQNLILFKFFPFVTAFNLSYIFIFLTAFIGCYLLFSEFRVIPFLSFMGALIFTLSGFFITQIVHPNLIHAAAYFPLLFFLLERWTKICGQTGKSAPTKIIYLLLFIFFQTQCFLAGFPQLFLIINFFFFLYLWFLRRGGSGRPAPWGGSSDPPLHEKIKQNIIATLSNNISIYAYTILIALILCLPQIIPSLEFTKQAGRNGGVSIDALSAFPYNPKHLLSFLNPFIFGNPKYATYPVFNQDWGIFWESTFYVGAMTFLIYLIAVFLNLFFSGSRRRTATVLSSHKTKSIFKIGLISLLLGFGKYTPLFLIIQFPPFNMFRTPARFMFLFMFSVIFVTILFLDRIYKNLQKNKLRLFRNGQWPFPTIFMIVSCLLIIPELLFQFSSYHLILPAKSVLTAPKIAKYLKPNDVVFSYNPYENWNKIFMKKGWGSEKETQKYVFLKNQFDENINALWNINSFNVYASSFLQNQSFVNRAIMNLLIIKQGKKNEIKLNREDLGLFKKYGVNTIISPVLVKGKFVKLISQLKSSNLTIYIFRLNIKTFVWYLPSTIITKKSITANDLAKLNIETAIIQSKKDKSPIVNKKCNALQIKKNGNTFYITHRCTKNTFVILNRTYYPGNKIIVNGKVKKPIEVNVSQTGTWL